VRLDASKLRSVAAGYPEILRIGQDFRLHVSSESASHRQEVTCHATFFNRNKNTRFQISGVALQHGHEDGDYRLRPATFATEPDDRWRVSPPDCHEGVEIRVQGDRHIPTLACDRENILVVRPLHAQLGYVQALVPELAKQRCRVPREFPDPKEEKGYETWRLSRGRCVPNLVSQIGRCKLERLTDIVFLQVRIVPKQFLTVGPGSHSCDNAANCQAHIANTRLAVQLFRVPRNSVEHRSSPLHCPTASVLRARVRSRGYCGEGGFLKSLPLKFLQKNKVTLRATIVERTALKSAS